MSQHVRLTDNEAKIREGATTSAHSGTRRNVLDNIDCDSSLKEADRLEKIMIKQLLNNKCRLSLRMFEHKENTIGVY